MLDPTDETSRDAGEDDDLLRRIAHVDDLDPTGSPLAEGTAVAQFRVVSELGRGGMGVVYLAEDTKLRRRVALKVLRPSLARDDARRRLLVREARAAAAVSHPNIAAVHELGEADGLVFIAMERVEGRSLRARLAGEALPVAEAIDVALQVLRGLGTAHAAGLIHCDLKPENVMITDEGAVKLLDFGLAKLSAPEGATGTSTSLPALDARAGTPAYMSPEQIVGDALDARSDLFSFGVMAYEMLSGRRPFTGETLSALTRAVVAAEPAPLAQLRPELPPAVARVVTRCLAKAPEDRPADAAAVAAELRAAPERRSPPARRLRPALAALLAVLALGGGWLATRGHRGGAPARAPEPVLRLTSASTVACPVWQARGVREPSGWLGAAGADLACELLLLRGALPHGALRVPARLLGLPQLPSDEASLEDPFGAADARARSLAAAQGASLVLDGLVERGATELKVTLIARLPGGAELGRAEAHSDSLPTAVWTALEELVARGRIVPAAETLSKELLPQGTDSPSFAAWGTAVTLRIRFGGDATDECRRLLAVPGEERSRRGLLAQCYPGVERGPPTRAADDSVSALAHAAGEADEIRPEERASLRARIERVRAAEPSPVLQAGLLNAEAQLWMIDGDRERARACALEALKLVADDDFAAELLVQLDRGTAQAARTARWAEAWMPIVLRNEVSGPEEALRLARRSYELHGLTDPYPGMGLGPMLVDRGLVAEAQAVAAGYLAGPPHLRRMADIILAQVAFGEGALGRGRDHLERFLAATPAAQWGGIELTVANRLLRLGDVLGEAHAIADGLLDRALLDVPYDLARTWLWPTLLGACWRAGPDHAGRCLARFDALRRTDDFGGTISEAYARTVDGVKRRVRGDARGAAQAWRGLDPTDNFYPLLVDVTVFDQVGASADASAIDAKLMDHATGRTGGATPAHAREALRAHKRGDRARAAELAKIVVDAWGRSDVPVPCVAPVRDLLR